jgi:hypothetical protein
VSYLARSSSSPLRAICCGVSLLRSIGVLAFLTP